MNYLSAESISKSFNEKLLFKNITFGISQGEKVALVGINGSGKSTLLKIILKEEKQDEGVVSFKKDIKVSSLGQNPVFNEEETVMDSIFNTENELLTTIRDYEYHLHHSATETRSQELLPDLIERMDALQAWDFESQIQQILGKLGLYDLDKKIKHLSGGQKKRVALAKALIDKPDLLILDEPTNHLDLETIEWLENFLAGQQLTLLLVTHDRYFLEKVTNVILELDGGALHKYKGNYTYYLEKKAEREEREATEVEKAKNLLRKEQEWMRRQPRARGTKAKYRIDAFYDLKDKASKNLSKPEMELSVQTQRQGGKILEVDHISKSYDGKKIIDDYSYVFKKGDRIGIIGPNGIGKSTYLNILSGRNKPDSGTVDPGSTTQFGYYTQMELDFKESQRVIDIVKEIAEVVKMGDGREITASQFLLHFQFPPQRQYDMVSKLSGGEKRRLQLLRVLIKNPNFLILDEPTNDLDIMTLNILEEFLLNFKGCLLLVSHDRYFMDQLVDHIFIFEGEGQIKDFPGNYSGYRLFKSEFDKENEKPVSKPKELKTASTNKKDDKRKLSFNEKKEYEKLEKEIAALEVKKEQIIVKLNMGSQDHQELAKWAKNIKSIDEEIEAKSSRWLELGEFFDN
ncbi:MAG: ABC-F family ATP-binding cassette domain-containing protein [Bacteroidota bacterium]|nr:ABC-F family ATP-binding cassette domain-containing protein [Bacteroidota bacterium]